MNSKLKTLCVLAAIVSFALCTYGAYVFYSGVESAQIGVASFMLGVAVFAFFSLIGISVIPSISSSNESVQPSAVSNKRASAKVVKATKSIPLKNEPVKREPELQKNNEDRPARVHVANLCEEITETELREEFAVFGSVKSVRIISDKETGKPKGYAFIEMDKKSEAKLAIDDINGQEIKGQEVKVSFARPRSRRNYRGPRRQPA